MEFFFPPAFIRDDHSKIIRAPFAAPSLPKPPSPPGKTLRSVTRSIRARPFCTSFNARSYTTFFIRIFFVTRFIYTFNVNFNLL